MGAMPFPTYPWYARVSGPELEQGDILLGCPVFVIPPEAADEPFAGHEVLTRIENVIVMTQSCDLATHKDGSRTVDEVVLCPVYLKRELRDDRTFCRNENWNAAKRGRIPAYHVLNRCDIEGLALDYMVVALHRVYSLSVPLVRRFAAGLPYRVRLCPPYREHLAQAFARFFMRVGLPVDIPDFR
jgi:hypothetical protein